MLGCITGFTYWEKDFNAEKQLPSDIGQLVLNDTSFQLVFQDLNARFRQLTIDPNHRFFPKLSDLKVLRPDSLAAIIMTQALLFDLNIAPKEREEMMLLVANSNFIDDNVLDFVGMSKDIENIQKADTDEEKNRILGSGISPLIPLRTLTNGSESFIAQYTQILGENTTYGSTAMATAHALSDACSFIKIGAASTALVGGTNYANLFSLLNNYLVIEHRDGYSESSASSFLMVETEASAKSANRDILAVISQIHFNQELPNHRSYDWLFFGGAFTDQGQAHLVQKMEKISSNIRFSWFPYTGNMGCAELGMMISASLTWMLTGQNALIYLEDIYGQYVTLILEKR